MRRSPGPRPGSGVPPVRARTRHVKRVQRLVQYPLEGFLRSLMQPCVVVYDVSKVDNEVAVGGPERLDSPLCFKESVYVIPGRAVKAMAHVRMWRPLYIR